MKSKSTIIRIDAKKMYYRELNGKIHLAIDNGVKEIILDNVNGQRYIGDGLKSDIKIVINGVPGNDLAAFMDGPTIIVNSNAQDGIGNTMNAGKIIVYGDGRDIVGHSMRGGKIYIRGNVGYRVGIHMKAYRDLYPVIVVGGTAGDFLGEYMAGGLIIILGLNRQESEPIVGNYIGTGMHGGRIYIRGEIEDYQLGKEIRLFSPEEEDRGELNLYLKEYCQYFSLDFQKILKGRFVRLAPYTHRPYGKLYAY